jgi:hypothetical protein
MTEDNMREYRKLEKEYYDKMLPKDDNGVVAIDTSVPLFRKPEYGDTWGIWEYRKNKTLACDIYEVYLDQMNSSAEVLDWIVQVSHKTWVTEKHLADLIYAIDDILSLQPNYCGFGIDKTKR